MPVIFVSNDGWYNKIGAFKEHLCIQTNSGICDAKYASKTGKISMSSIY